MIVAFRSAKVRACIVDAKENISVLSHCQVT